VTRGCCGTSGLDVPFEAGRIDGGVVDGQHVPVRARDQQRLAGRSERAAQLCDL
jgi:hypothetical protein